MAMAPADRSHQQNHVVQALCLFQYLVRHMSVSSYLRRLSLRFLLNELLHHNGENGPGGIRTRICDCDRVLCSPYTTGPERVFSDSAGNSKVVGHSVLERVLNWDKRCTVG